MLEDAVLAWRYLKPGGVMCFDDYQWDDVVLEWMKPGIAVDAFVRCYQNLIASAKRRGKDQFVVVKALSAVVSGMTTSPAMTPPPELLSL